MRSIPLGLVYGYGMQKRANSIPVLTLYNNYMEILESEGKEEAEEYKIAERNKVCANKIRYIVSLANSSDSFSCSQKRWAEKNHQRVLQRAAQRGFLYDGAFGRLAEEYRTKCKDDRARTASKLMQNPAAGFNGPKCLQLQEAGEIKHPPYLEPYIKQYDFTLQSYCENSEFGCDYME
jgi:hypothetical protein